jgi:hypothetical protein
MRASVRPAFTAHVERYEGRCSWMYLDTKALVTTGVGNLIDPIGEAVRLPWARVDGTPATEQEIRADWWAIKGTPSLALRGAQAARSVAKLHLTEEAIDELVAGKLEAFWATLLGYFPGACEWPADAQLGLLLHAWAVGPHAHRRGWPRLSAALDACDWQTAAEEVVIPGARPARNEAHQLCFRNAAAGADPEVLFYPEAVV